MPVIREISLTKSGGELTNYDIGAKAENVAYNQEKDIKTVLDEKLDANGTLQDNVVGNISAVSLLEQINEDDVGSEVFGKINKLIAEHQDIKVKDVASEDGAFGIRYVDDTLQVFFEGEWVEVSAGGGVSAIDIGDVVGVNLAVTRKSVAITWTDPNDAVVDGITLARWTGTMVRRKAGSAPVDEKDGDLVAIETTRNSYSVNPLVDDSDKEYGITYYYRFFPYTGTGKKHYTAGTASYITLRRIPISVEPEADGLVYNGTVQAPSWRNYNSEQLQIGGSISGTNVGSYTAFFIPKSDYCWASTGSTDDVGQRSKTWFISKMPVTEPSITKTWIYDGNLKSIDTEEFSDFEDFNATYMEIDPSNSTLEAYNIGTYTVRILLKDTVNTRWSEDEDSRYNYIDLTWSIGRAEVAFVEPDIDEDGYDFDGMTKGPTINGDYDPTVVTITGSTGIHAGSYVLRYSLKTGYIWDEIGDSNDITRAWRINKKAVNEPVVSNPANPVYNGVEKYPLVNYGGDEAAVEIRSGSIESAIEAGTYAITFGLKNAAPYEDYYWKNSSTQQSADITKNWEIQRATGTLTLDSNAIELSSNNLEQVINYDFIGDEDTLVTGVSMNTNIATVAIDQVNKTITIRTVNNTTGNTTVNITVENGVNYTPVTQSIAVTATFLSLDEVTNVTFAGSSKRSVRVNWTDPGSKTDGTQTMNWIRTVVVRKAGSPPTLTDYDKIVATVQSKTHNNIVDNVNSYDVIYYYNFYVYGKTEGSEVEVITGSSITYSYTPQRDQIVMPTVATNSFEYNGSPQTLTLNGFDSISMTIQDNSATEIGTYYGIVTPREDYRWLDGEELVEVHEFINDVESRVYTTDGTETLSFDLDGLSSGTYTGKIVAYYEGDPSGDSDTLTFTFRKG